MNIFDIARKGIDKIELLTLKNHYINQHELREYIYTHKDYIDPKEYRNKEFLRGYHAAMYDIWIHFCDGKWPLEK